MSALDYTNCERQEQQVHLDASLGSVSGALPASDVALLSPAELPTSSSQTLLHLLRQATVNRVCKESMMNAGYKGKINLVVRDTWMDEYLVFLEWDGDSYSRNGHPPHKLMLTKTTNEMEICGWQQTPCKYGERCWNLKRGHCLFIHSSCKDEVEVAAGSALRCRQIKRDFEVRRGVQIEDKKF